MRREKRAEERARSVAKGGVNATGEARGGARKGPVERMLIGVRDIWSQLDPEQLTSQVCRGANCDKKIRGGLRVGLLRCEFEKENSTSAPAVRRRVNHDGSGCQRTGDPAAGQPRLGR